MPNPELDAIDRRIISELQADARLTNIELADRVGLSPSPCLRRVRRLADEGVVAGYRAVLHRSRIGLGLTVFLAVKIGHGTWASHSWSAWLRTGSTNAESSACNRRLAAHLPHRCLPALERRIVLPSVRTNPAFSISARLRYSASCVNPSSAAHCFLLCPSTTAPFSPSVSM
jgi:DNA-binding Lrp family transcriptional regulator